MVAERLGGHIPGRSLVVRRLPGAIRRAASPTAAEEAAFRSAFKMFQDFQYPLAETNFSKFLLVFTNSTHRADAILFLARRPPGAIQLQRRD